GTEPLHRGGDLGKPFQDRRRQGRQQGFLASYGHTSGRLRGGAPHQGRGRETGAGARTLLASRVIRCKRKRSYREPTASDIASNSNDSKPRWGVLGDTPATTA